MTEGRAFANGIVHHVIHWHPKERNNAAPIVLCHGFLDTAWSYKWVAESLAARGHAVSAFDWRGHGDSGWVGDGGYYHFPDYVRDLHLLIPQLTESDAPINLVGHSMDGTACTLFTGAVPDRVKTLTLIEGIGPMTHDVKVTPDRFGAFLRTTDKFDGAARAHDSGSQAMPNIEDVL